MKVAPLPSTVRRPVIDLGTGPVLVTGAAGFIGVRVVDALLKGGVAKVRCFVRPSSNLTRLRAVTEMAAPGRVELQTGNLLSRQDCASASAGVGIAYHLAAGVDKSYAGAFMNSVVTTRNLIEALLDAGTLKRFVSVSSFAVYCNASMRRGAVLDEGCSIETPAYRRREAYCYGKIKQDRLVERYGRERGLPYVIVRPGAVYGPGKRGITGRVGIDTFGTFLHLGRSISLPLTYVDNCADAICLAGLTPGVEGEVFNVVDDETFTSAEFLRLYKRHVRPFRSLRLPYALTYLLCLLWELYSDYSEGQVPPVFNRSRCSAEWKGNRYSNLKARKLLGWTPAVNRNEAVRRYLEYQRAIEAK